MLTRTSTYERSARLEKAVALVAVLAEHQIAASDVALMTDEHWRMLAKAARVNPPSWRTQQMILGMMMRSN
jgi:hypothetical protein